MKIITDSIRLLLREMVLNDAPNLVQLNSDPDIERFTGDKPFESLAAAEKFIKNYDHYAKYKMGRWSLILKETNEFTGWCGLKTEEDGQIDLGYRIIKKHRGLGYATEASIACLEYGFNELSLERIIGKTVPNNLNSINVLKKLGMVYEGKIICEEHDAVLYSINKSQWCSKVSSIV